MEVLWVDKIFFIFFNYEAKVLYLSFVVPGSCYPLSDQHVHFFHPNLTWFIFGTLFLWRQWYLSVIYWVYSWSCTWNWWVNVVSIAEYIEILSLDASWGTNLRHHCLGRQLGVTWWDTVQFHHWESFIIEDCVQLERPWDSLCSCSWVWELVWDRWHLTWSSWVITCSHKLS